MPACRACVVLEKQVAYLQTQLADAQDRLLAVVSPQALAQVKGKSLPTPGAGATESYIDDQGRAWVTINGKAVPLEEYTALMEKAGYIDNTGAFIPATEHKAAMDKLDEVLGGQTA